MSFLLEALRRADRERKTGTNPDLQSVVAPTPVPPARRRSSWPAAAGIVLLGAGAAGLLLWPRGELQALRPVAAEARPTSPGPAPTTLRPVPVPTADAPTSAARDPRQGTPAALASTAAPQPPGPEPRPTLVAAASPAPVPAPAAPTEVSLSAHA